MEKEGGGGVGIEKQKRDFGFSGKKMERTVRSRYNTA